MFLTKKEKEKKTVQTERQGMSAEQIMQAVAILAGGGQILEKEISHETREGDQEHIIIPRGMSKLAAAQELERQYEEEETKINLTQLFEGYLPDDTFVAVKEVCEEMFGWVNAKARMTFFGPILPEEVKIQIGLENNMPVFENCIFGRFGITAWEDAVADLKYAADKKGNACGSITLELKKKYKDRASALFSAVFDKLKEKSIYKGKTLKYEDGRFVFIEANASPNVILNEDENVVIENFILKKLGKKNGKTSVLFTGDYGTGKSETAIKIGAVASKEHNITFIYCKDADKFAQLLSLAKNYQPAIIFLEDVDNIGGGEARDSRMNDLLNTLDGIETKGQELMTIFTTNHEKRINKALRRPGRIDQIVRFAHCNPETVERIFRKFFEDVAGGDSLDYQALAQKAPVIQGSVIAEISKRAIDLANGTNSGVLNDEVVEAAIASMKFQIEFMKEDVDNTETPNDKIVNNLVDVIVNSKQMKANAVNIESIAKNFGVAIVTAEDC